jgi:nitrite reductase/ring-hydroxylating ferredoxin subunit
MNRLKVLRQALAPDLVQAARKGETALAAAVLHEHKSFYTDQEQFERERERLFRTMPLVACLSSDLPSAGSYRTFDDTGIPILIARGGDGQVRAFLNICPHRASRLVRDAQGQSNRFTCRFHGWTFDNSGNNVGIPEERYFCGEIDAQKHLIACSAEERHGLVFVQVAPGSKMDLDAHLHQLDADLAVLGLASAEVTHRDLLPVRANWKYGLDTFFETYHLKSLHRETFRGLFSPLCVFYAAGLHHRYTFSPLGIQEWVGRAREQWPVDSIPLQYFLFPNTIFSVGSTSPTGLTMSIHQVFPQSVDHFVSRLSYCVIGGVKSEEHRAEIERAYSISRSALINEDYSVAAEAHAGLAALPRESTLPIGQQEIGVQNFHQNVRRMVGAA